MQSIRQKCYFKDFQNQCVYVLDLWIKEYLKRHDLELMEIDFDRKLVFCYNKNCNNFLEDYFSFNYTKRNLFK